MNTAPFDEEVSHTKFLPQLAIAETGAQRSSDLWALLRILVHVGIPGERMGMVRWDRLPHFMGKHWLDVAQKVADVIRKSATEAIGPMGACIRFDDFGLLVILGGDNPSTFAVEAPKLASVVRKRLFGNKPNGDLIQAWAALSFDPDGLDCQIVNGTGAVPATSSMDTAGAHKIVYSDPEFLFQPLWESRQNSVLCYLCQPVWKQPNGQLVSGEVVAHQVSDDEGEISIDVEVLRAAIDKLNDLLGHERMAQLLIPIHYRALTNPDFLNHYIAEARSASFQMRSKAFLEIVDLPPHFDKSQFLTIAAELRSLVKGVFVRVSFDFNRFEDVFEAHAYSIGISLRNEIRPEAEIINSLEAFATHAEAYGLHTHVHGVKTTSLSVAAVCAGFNLVGSEAVENLLEGIPLDDHFITPNDLYKNVHEETKQGVN